MRKKAIVAIVVSVVIAAIGMGGCSGANSSAEKSKTSAAFIVGGHANSSPMDFGNKVLREVAEDTVNSFGELTVISCDGDPEVVKTQSYDIDDQYKSNPELLKKMAAEEAENVLDSFADVKADDPEADILYSISLAVDALANVEKESAKIIYIIDSGLQTAGLLNFGNNILTSGQPEMVAEQLAEKQALPDLNNTKVYFQHLGKVASPQQKLTPAQNSNLVKTWEAIVKKGGGTFIEVKGNGAPTGEEDVDLPLVTPIELPAEDPVTFDPEASIDLSRPNFLTEKYVRFVADAAEYVDVTSAENVIRPIAEYMNEKENQSIKVLIVGTTAGDENTSFNIDLSNRRAARVKSTLVGMGVDPARIKVIGKGCEDPWHWHGAGVGNSEGAIKNRKVVLIDADSKTARSLI